MVTNVTSFTGNGFRDWLWQRLSAVILAAYTIFFLVYALLPGEVTFTQWQTLFHSRAMQVASSVVLVNLLIHAFIGVWTIATDYIKPNALRILFHASVLIALMSYLVWGFVIIWA